MRSASVSVTRTSVQSAGAIQPWFSMSFQGASYRFGPINETVLYAVVALYLAYAEAGLAYGVDAYLEKMKDSNITDQDISDGEMRSIERRRRPR